MDGEDDSDSEGSEDEVMLTRKPASNQKKSSEEIKPADGPSDKQDEDYASSSTLTLKRMSSKAVINKPMPKRFKSTEYVHVPPSNLLNNQLQRDTDEEKSDGPDSPGNDLQEEVDDVDFPEVDLENRNNAGGRKILDVLNIDGLDSSYSTRTVAQPHTDTEESIMNGNPTLKYPKKYRSNHGDGNTTRKTWKCWYCPSSQYDLTAYLTHKNGHLNKYDLECPDPDCSFSCHSQKILIWHVKCHNPQQDKIVQKKFSSSHSIANSYRRKRSSYTHRKRKSTCFQKSKGETTILNDSSTSTLPDPDSTTTQFKCLDPKCPVTFDTQNNLDSHMNRHTTDSYLGGRFQCKLCTYRINKVSLIKSHLWKHGVDGNQYAVKKKSLSTSLQTHKPKNTGIDIRNTARFQCPSCPAKFVRQLWLKMHLERHKDTTSKYKCKFCSYTVCSNHLLEKHISLHQSLNELDNSSTASISVLPRKQLKKRSALTSAKCPQKQNDNNGKPEIHCTVSNCPHVFHRLIDLKNHLPKHFEKAKLTCNICGYATNASRRFRIHQQKHSNAGDVDVCSTVVPRKRAGKRKTGRRNLVADGLIRQQEMDQIRAGNPMFKYETHKTVGSVTIAQSFRCYKCPKSFPAFGNWLQHQNTHGKSTVSAIRTYRCKPCKYVTHTREYFVAHCARRNCSTEPMIQTHLDAAMPRIELPTNTLESTSNSELPVPTVHNEAKLKSETTLSEDILIEPQRYLITEVNVCNFMLIDESIIEPTRNLCCIQGGVNAGKTTTIVACLIGICYDILLELPENSTICGVDISNVLRHGETDGFVEATLNLKLCEELRQEFGNQLRLRRNFRQGVLLSESEIEISYGTVERSPITRSQIKSLMSKLIPLFIVRMMVLNAENVQYLAENFQTCDEMFWKIADARKTSLLLKTEQIRSQLTYFVRDIESRKLRMSYLNESLKKDYKDIPKLRHLQVAHAIELNTALEQFNDVKTLYKKMVQDEVTINADVVNQLEKLVDKMRKPFQKYLYSQNYVGDLVIGDNGQEFIVWVKDSSGSAVDVDTVQMEEARQIYKRLTLGRRKLVIIGLYVAFWRVMDCCPIVVSDAFSASDLEFKFPNSALPVLLGVVREEPARQFFLSLPEVLPKPDV